LVRAESALSGLEEPSTDAIDQRVNDEYGVDPEDNPLQLEHIMGFTDTFRHTVVMSPTDENIFFKRCVCY
jgi:hypothetical protein